MKHTFTKRVVTLILTVALLLGVVPMTAYATIENWEQNNVVFEGTSFGTNGYYNVISKKDYTLVPGAAVESEMVINNAQGNRRNVMHIIEVDPSNPDVSVLPGYYNIDKDLTDVNNWKAAGVTDVAKYYEDTLGYNVVGAMNTDLDYTDNAPRVLVYNGQNLAGYAGAAAPRSVLYVWNIDGQISCQVAPYNKAELEEGVANGTLLHAISVSFAMVVNNGELVTKTEERTSEKAARSMVGVKEDGTLVLVMNDGRGANNSVGFCNYEEGEAMLALGCKWAANCDGGGSSSFVTKRAGETEGVCRCVPCDGAERPTKSSVIVVSNVGPTGELNNINVEGDYDYFAPGTTYTFDAQAIDTHGYAMDVPADAAWKLSDASFGTIADGTFTSNGTQGDVDVQVTVNATDVTDRSVVFTNNKGLSDVKIYYWSDENENMIAWPGEAMNEYDINEFNEPRYIFDLPEGATKFIINGTKTDNSAYQTADLSFNGMIGIYLDDNYAAQPYDISTKIVGSKTIHIANPTTLELSATETVLPYSTPEKVRTTTIPVVSKIGENNVYTDGSTYSTAIAPEGSGSIDGLVFTATDDQTIAQSVVTLTYLPTNTEMTYTVTYGKGSEILWDFEDGIDGWLGQQDAHDWQVAHGVTPFDEDATSGNSLYKSGQMNGGSRSKTFVSTVENGGKVHNGNQALGVEYDFRGADFNSWVYMILFNVLNENGENPDCVLRDTENGKNATSIGMWVYLPVGFRDEKNAGSLALQMNLFYRKADGTTGQAGVNMQYKGKNINALTEADIPDGRWIYVKGALPNHPYVALTDPLQSNYRAPSVFRMYVKPSVAQTLTYYYDDITLDYSSAVDDREEPVISNPCYAYTDTAITINNGDDVPYYVDFSANAADFAASNASGIDPTSAAVYLDGVKFNNAGYFNGQIIAEDYPLSEGQHTVIFEISDNLGNIAQLKRTINCTSTNFQGLYLDGHNDSGSAPLAGSMYYLDLKAKNIENIDKVETTIDLQTANTWEAEHLEVADGFTATYTVNEAEPEFVTFTIEKTGDVSLTGDQTLLTVPVRVWDWDESWPYGGDGSAVQYGKAGRYTKYGEPVLKVAADVVYGKVNYIQNAETTTASFGGTYSVDTVVDGNKTSGLWHSHDAELTQLPDKAATCLEEGYEGRTYCETCQSIVDWGTTIPTGGHNYEYVDGAFVCSVCGDEYDYSDKTGLFTLSGKTYYAIGGNLVSGWQQIEDDWYWFNTTNYAAAVGQVPYGSVTYTFNDDGKLAHGEWYNDGVGTKYYYGPDYYRCHAANPNANTLWAEIDGERYAFDRQGHRHENVAMLIESNNAPKMHEFTSEGVYVGEYVTDYTGVFPCNGRFCYLENGVPVQKGLVEYEGDYYYINSSRLYVTGTYNCTNHMTTQIPPGTYEFGEDGKMINPPQPQQPTEAPTLAPDAPTQAPAPTEETEVKNGIYEENGKLWYYENGAKKQVGLINIDGDWYYVRSGGLVATGEYNCTYHMTAQIPAGKYTFGPDGKMINPPQPQQPTEAPTLAPDAPTEAPAPTEETEVKNGIYEENGKLWYYENGAKKQVGLINIDGDWYYVRSGGLVATGEYNCTYHMTAQIPAGKYTFGPDGKMINPPVGPTQPTEASSPTEPASTDPTEPEQVKDGIVHENGGMFYYKDGVLQKAAGVIVLDGNYYFVRTSGRLAVGDYSIGSGTHDFVRGGLHHFDETTGIMDVDPYYLVGIRGGRDIAFLNQWNDVQMNEGLVFRGSEIDGAQYNKTGVDFTEEDKANAVALLTEKGIKTEIDLRTQTPGCQDMLGEGVTHNYYDMVYYDQIFTADGKAKVKAVFEELADPANYPVYIHCTYGLDRAGTVCYLLEALLGYNDWCLSHDYCSTINSHEESILKIKNGLIANYEGDTRQEQVTNYLLDCGLTQAQLDSICDILLPAD